MIYLLDFVIISFNKELQQKVAQNTVDLRTKQNPRCFSYKMVVEEDDQ